jgi:hypothetical protein
VTTPAAAKPARPGGAYRALSIGVTSFGDRFDTLPDAAKWASALRAQLDALGYATGDPVAAADLTSEAIGSAVQQEIEAAGEDDILVVHVVTHGDVVERNNTLYVLGSDGATHPQADVEHWLKTVQDGNQRPLVLFVLDICQAGTAARLPWQDATADGSARAWVLAACAPHERAFNGWLTRATTTVLGQLLNRQLDINPGVEFVSLQLVGRKIRAEVARLADEEGDGLRQQVTGSQLDFFADTPDLKFFRNPAFAPKRPVPLPPETDAALAPFTDNIREPTPTPAGTTASPSVQETPHTATAPPIAAAPHDAAPHDAANSSDTTAPTDRPRAGRPVIGRPRTGRYRYGRSAAKPPDTDIPGASGVGAPAADLAHDPDLDPAHFKDRASGYGPIPGSLDAGCFTGRLDQLNELVPWLQGYGPGGASRTLAVVTGGPGVGKSALLGVLVCAAHPALRDATNQLWNQARNQPPEMSQLVAVHARQRNLADVTASLARQLAKVLAPPVPDGSRQAQDDPPPIPADPAGLVAALAAADAGQPVPVIVLDALDESIGAQAIIDELIVPLVDARRPDGTPACRVLVGTRRDGFDPLLRAAAAQHGLIDLDEVDRTKLLEDLNGYVVKLLRTQPAYRTMPGVRGAFAEEVAAVLARQPEGDRRWGEFLIAGLYTHSFLRATAAAPLTSADEASQRGKDCPRTLPEVLELDLRDRPNETELRQVLQIVSLARGAGIPASVIDRCRPRKPRFGPWTPTLKALSQLGFYLRRASDEDGTTLYRVFHEGLADQLRPPDDPAADDDELLLRVWESDWEPGWSRQSAEEALVNAMLAPLGPADARSWDLAEPYTLRHIVDHALPAWTVASPALHRLLLDPDFLVHADPSLPATLQRLLADDVIILLVPRLLDVAQAVAPADRRAALALEAARARLPQLAFSFAQPPAGSPEPPLRWRPSWTAGQHLPPSLMTPLWPDITKTWAMPGPALATALTVATIDGNQVVVVVKGNQLCLRSITDGRSIRDRRLPDAGPGFGGQAFIQAAGVDPDGTTIVAIEQDTWLWSLPVDLFMDVEVTDREFFLPALYERDPAWPPIVEANAIGLDAQGPVTVAVEVVKLAGRLLVALMDTHMMSTPVDASSGRQLGPTGPYPDLRKLVADGRSFSLVLSAQDGVTLRLHEREHGILRLLDGYPACEVSAFNPDGTRHGQLIGHTGHITALTTMTLDGHPVAVTGSLDGTIRFWDVLGLREIERLTLPGPVQAVVPSGDDHLAVLCCGEAIIYTRHDPSRPPEAPDRYTVTVEITSIHRVPQQEATP